MDPSLPLEPFAVDPEIARAETPPAPFYSDPRWFTRITERVLARSWHALGLSAGLEAPGASRPITLLPGALDEELVLVRGEDGVLRLLSNVCTHRGMLVVEAECQVTGLRCRYHGRRFGLDGCFQSMPKFDQVEGFPTERDHLTSLPVAERHGMIFGALDPELSFEEWYAPVEERLTGIFPDAWTPAGERHGDYTFDANWMLYLDNYLEGFHIPFIHPGLTAAIPMSEYETHLLPQGTLQVAPAHLDDETALSPGEGHVDGGRRIAAWYYWLFPATLINVYPWGISLNVIEPLGPTRTHVAFRSIVADPSQLGGGASDDLHQVELEDEAAVIATQRGLRGRLYTRGRYSPEEEFGVHHFHRLLLERCRLDTQG